MRRALVLFIALVVLAGCGGAGSRSQPRSKPPNEANVMRQERRHAPITIDKQQDPNPYSNRPRG